MKIKMKAILFLIAFAQISFGMSRFATKYLTTNKGIAYSRLVAMAGAGVGLGMFAQQAKTEGNKTEKLHMAVESQKIITTQDTLADLVDIVKMASTLQERIASIQKEINWEISYQESLDHLYALLDSKNTDLTQARNYIDKEITLSHAKVTDLKKLLAHNEAYFAVSKDGVAQAIEDIKK